MEPTILFIDGGYLNKISKAFKLRIDIPALARALTTQEGLVLERVFYYTAPPFQSAPPTPEETHRRAKHDAWIAKLERDAAFHVRQGRCQKVNGEYHQKGVDTLVTMDLMSVPLKHQHIKKILVLACDTDFVPVLQELRKEQIHVTLFYYTDRVRGSAFSMSNHILTACDKQVRLLPAHLRQHQRPANDRPNV